MIITWFYKASPLQFNYNLAAQSHKHQKLFKNVQSKVGSKGQFGEKSKWEVHLS